MKKKKISIVVPTYYEQENVGPLSQAIIDQMNKLPEYEYDIIFIDNHSKDMTCANIRQLCVENPHIKAIFNVRNFGGFNSPMHGLFQSDGDCAILLCADFQDPIELIPLFLQEWEKGEQVVCGIKTSSKEKKLMYLIRSLYYIIIKKMSTIEQIEHFTGFGLYDRSFLDLIKSLNDTQPFLRGMVAEFAPECKKIPYEQPKRRNGNTSTNFFRLYDAAMLSITAYTKLGIRVATFLGIAIGGLSGLALIGLIILKTGFGMGFLKSVRIVDLMSFLFESLQLVFIGFLGEYILSINARTMNRPLAIEKERINFDEDVN